MSETRYIISDAAKMINVEPHVLRYWKKNSVWIFREMKWATDIIQIKKLKYSVRSGT